MSSILEIKGNVNYKITLDPSVWIFDDRHINLKTYFDAKEDTEEVDSYEEKMSNYWHREIREGSVAPPTLKAERKLKKVEILTGTFGIKFEPFIKNAEPLPGAKSLIIETKKENVTIALEEAGELILQFSNEGKPLKDDGPVYVLFNDGSNRNNPITHVTSFVVE
ncbi:peptidyl-prolyl cis-trans isomerase [Caldibacillus lycopersici]|uniref:Peptidyl-prolyl cis-trans isomerase n=1 Tax=Perspicuibacillus lycopersici TaxID=1325689 RepID=A0AAE3IPX2_9BACI|nr:peptidyl-prolyl cis-trans isomerase [Perspicuibacillus lycopersici]MCU9612241.1 peptidyl-prolyl cis-trans isomerase [Perspicuibacillus lycopersici]